MPQATFSKHQKNLARNKNFKWKPGLPLFKFPFFSANFLMNWKPGSPGPILDSPNISFISPSVQEEWESFTQFLGLSSHHRWPSLHLHCLSCLLEAVSEMRSIHWNPSALSRDHGLTALKTCTIFFLSDKQASYSTVLIFYCLVNIQENNNYTLLCRTGNSNQHQSRICT